jgi:hypothetical protein
VASFVGAGGCGQRVWLADRQPNGVARMEALVRQAMADGGWPRRRYLRLMPTRRTHRLASVPRPVRRSLRAHLRSRETFLEALDEF